MMLHISGVPLTSFAWSSAIFAITSTVVHVDCLLLTGGDLFLYVFDWQAEVYFHMFVTDSRRYISICLWLTGGDIFSWVWPCNASDLCRVRVCAVQVLYTTVSSFCCSSCFFNLWLSFICLMGLADPLTFYWWEWETNAACS